MKIFYTIIILIMLLTPFAKAEQEQIKNVPVIKVEKSLIKLDGKLTESCWQNQPINHFIQRDPLEGAPESEHSDVWIAYDDESIYVAAKLYDTKPDSIDASLSRRDGSFNSDWFCFYIDPYNDKKTGYYFKVNAGGAICDGVLYNDSWSSDSWDGIWEAKTNIDSSGWTLEMRIPFSQLRFKESDNMTWGINFSRQIKRKNENDYLIMIPKKESGFVSKFIPLEGLKGVVSKQRFEVLPYIVQKAQYLRHDSNDPFYKSHQYRTTVGADLKLGIGSSLNLDAAINPDFGQVEVDPAVINLSASESYFNEKRPFFIEGSNTFEFGLGGSNNFWGFNFGIPELLYTRRIGRTPQGDIPDNDYSYYPGETRIIGAAKLTGKINDFTTIGAISATTERTYATLETNHVRSEEEVEPFTHFGVLRARTELNGGKQALGFIFTSVNRDLRNEELKNDLAKAAYVFGLDGWTFLDKDQEYVITGAFAGSYTTGTKEFLQNLQERSYRYMQRPDATFMRLDSSRTSLSGGYGRIMLNKQKGNFYINSAIGAVTPGFEQNDLGFQFMADRINGHVVVGYNWFDPDPVFRNKNVYIAYSRSFDFDGNPISNFFWFSSSFKFLNYWGFNFGGYLSPETMSKSLTRGGPLAKNPSEYSLNWGAYSDSRNKFIVTTNGSLDIDKTNGKDFYFGFSFSWKPNPQFNLSFEPSFEIYSPKTQWVDSFEDNTAVNTYNHRYVFAEMLQHTIDAGIRINYTFTPALSFQVYIQPYFSAAAYSRFKELAKPKTLIYNEFAKNGATVSYDAEQNQYNIDPDGNGPAPVINFDNPDFNFKSLRGNAVLRWEARPGSIFYLVWSRNQTNEDYPGDIKLGRDLNKIINSDGDSVVMLKFSYWLDM